MLNKAILKVVKYEPRIEVQNWKFEKNDFLKFAMLEKNLNRKKFNCKLFLYNNNVCSVYVKIYWLINFEFLKYQKHSIIKLILIKI